MTLVVVTASRAWLDHEHLGFTVLDSGIRRVMKEYPPPYKLLHGAARGGDVIASVCARARGWSIEADPCTEAEWRKYGRGAGHRRNARMLARKPDVVLGAPYGKARGTWGCILAARRLGIPTIVMTRYLKRRADAAA